MASIYLSTIQISEEEKEQLNQLKELVALELFKDRDFAIDLETTGLQPYEADSKIVTFALTRRTDQGLHTVAVEATPQNLAKLKDIILSSGKRIAHRSQFEQEWLAYFLGNDILYKADWECTLSQAYVLNEQRRTHSLDYLTKLYFGIRIKSLSQIDVRNMVSEFATKPDEVLRYNGLDAFYTYMLYEKQKALLEEEGLVSTYNMLNKNIPAIVLATKKGLLPDSEKALEFQLELQTEEQRIEKEIRAFPEVQAFVPPAKQTQLNLSSVPQLKKLFTILLGEEPKSTDQEFLETVEHPIAKLLLDFRQVKKLRTTYIEPFIPGGKYIHGDGLIHPFYHMTYTATGRLSASDPSIQNFPARERKDLRSIIKAPDGYVLVACDYAAIEARVIAVASQDEYLLKHIRAGEDIHREWTEKLAHAAPRMKGAKAALKDPKAFKKLRSAVKNSWVFPAFYGAQLSSIAGYLDVPEATIEPLFNEFWGHYRGVKQWQKNLIAKLRLNGYVETLTGRRRHLPMTENEAINSPIQWTASDIVVDAMNRLAKEGHETGKPYLQAVMNIHDDLTFLVPIEELEGAIETIGDRMVHSPFPFINVPLEVEISVGHSWGTLEPITTITSS